MENAFNKAGYTPVAPVNPAASALPAPTILIVDDVPGNLVAIERVLEGFGARLLLADSGERALEMLLAERDAPALALLDVQMPGMDGYELATLMRKQPKSRTMPIIFLSAVFRDMNHILKGYSSGAVDFITKPFSTPLLQSKARVFVDMYLYRQEALAATAQLAARQAAEEARLKLLAQTTHQGKLATLGEMATGVMHEINQPLSYLSALVHTQLRARQKGVPFPEDKLGEMLNESARQIERIGKIMDHLRTFGRGETTDRLTPVSWPVVLDNALILMGQKLKHANIELVREEAPALPPVLGDENAFEQILINFLQNSLHALEGRKDGRIEIAMRVEEGRGKGEGGRVEIRFSDNGAGMPPEVRDKCFEPFYTTKDVGQGTGIGLSLVHGIVAKYGGSIEVESAPEAGTSFTLRFPVMSEMKI